MSMLKLKVKIAKQRLAYQSVGPQGIVTKHKVRMNPEHGQIIADAYDQMKHDPTNPDVKASYDAFKQETKNQFNELQQGGLKVTKLRPDQPGYTTASQMHRDIEGGNLNYYPSEQGFGTGSTLDHPLLEGSGIFDQEGKEIPYNDLFRIVHDVNGHNLGNKSDFSPEGEHAAFLTHRQQYSPLAQGALFTETAGQANWGAYNRKSGAANRDKISAGKFNELEFAEQKAGLMPREILEGNWHG